MGELDGQVAVVTGSGRGIGAATARLLARAGATVVLNDVDAAVLEAAVQALRAEGLDAQGVVADVRTAAGAERLIQTALGLRGRLEVLVNNVGGSGTRDRAVPTSVLRMEWDDMLETFRHNVEGMFRCTRLALPGMCERRYGRIVSVSSLAGRSRSLLGGPAYAAAKAAIIGFTRHTSAELAAFNVTINAVAPGLILSERVRARVEGRAPEVQRELLRTIPLGRGGESEEVAAAIAFLCSPAASYITGAVLDVNGGVWVG